MSKYNFIILFLFIFSIQYIAAQKNNKNYTIVFQEYQQANTLFNKAIQLSFDKNYEERNEINLNKLALRKFIKVEEILDKDYPTDSLLFFTDLKIGELEHYFDSLNLALQF